MKNDIYTDIATRTGGDIYIGVVGPVRTGKSTFIKQFMEQFVIPNIESDYRKERAIDELPQSSAGKTIMTTEPKFIPEEAVNITLEGGASFNVRMIDCVGYIIPSAIGYIENEAPRMVVTPWFDTEVPFNMAAEVGTQKVITEHSTIGLVVTTDGSITDLPREEYEECEERIIDELKQIGKPFVVLMNTTEPYSQQTKDLCEQLSDKYGTTVMPINCLELSEKEIKEILTLLLYSFPVKEINISMPSWINSLDKGHWLKEAVFGHIKEAASAVTNLRDISDCAEKICCCEQVSSGSVAEIDLGKGSAVIKVELDEEKKAFIISGSVTFCIIGRNEDGTPLYLENDSPFEHEIPLPENVNGEISISPDLCIENCTYYLADETTAELKADIKIGGEMTIQQTGTMISELRVLTDKPKEKNDKYALKICYCNESDDIWEIAKKYSTSITAILEENELTDDKISKQGMLLIPLMN